MEKVNIMIGRFQPMTIGHLKCIEAAADRGYRTVICMIETTKTDPKKPFPSSVLLPIYKKYMTKNKDIADIILVKSANIIDIMKSIDDYEVEMLVCGADRAKDYKRITTDYKDEAGLSDDFKLLVLHRSDEDVSATKVRQSIMDDDYNTFEKLYIPFETKKSFNTFKKYL